MKYEKTLAVLAGLTFAGSLAQAQIAIGFSKQPNDDQTSTFEVEIDASYVKVQ